jgi:hypothetical protein
MCLKNSVKLCIVNKEDWKLLAHGIWYFGEALAFVFFDRRQKRFVITLIAPQTLFYFLKFCGMGWNWAHLVSRPLIGLLYLPRMIDDDEYGAVGGMRNGKGNQSTQRKPPTVPLCSPQIPHDLTLAQTRAAEAGSFRLTASTMARHSYRL